MKFENERFGILNEDRNTKGGREFGENKEREEEVELG